MGEIFYIKDVFSEKDKCFYRIIVTYSKLYVHLVDSIEGQIMKKNIICCPYLEITNSSIDKNAKFQSELILSTKNIMIRLDFNTEDDSYEFILALLLMDGVMDSPAA